MYLIDTSIWIDVFRDRTQARAAQLKARLGGGATVLCRFTQLELLQGAKDQQEWELLDSYLSEQRYLEMAPASWREAARLYFTLRRAGKTVRSSIDCGIAQLAIDHGATLWHRDRDFLVIGEHSKLIQEWIEWKDS